jgi:hypothetical protein
MKRRATTETLAPPLARVDVRPEHTRNAIHEMLASPADLRRIGQAAQRRVHDGILVLAQLRSWAQLIAAALEPYAIGAPRRPSPA